jgi:hypothetical protein
VRANRILAAALLTCCFSTWATSAQAGIIAHATLIKDPSAGIPFGAPDAVLPAPWVSYRLSVLGSGDSQFQAFQVTILGALHQRWADANSNSVPDPTATSLDQTGGDSHLLAPPDSQFGSDPVEDNPGTGSPLPNTDPTSILYGVGTSLAGAWAFPGGNVTSADLAYIVIPKGSERSLKIDVLAAEPADPIWQLTTRDFSPVPEPSSITLAGLALTGLAVVGYRRAGEVGA